jgi:hypothetical protein
MVKGRFGSETIQWGEPDPNVSKRPLEVIRMTVRNWIPEQRQRQRELI